MSRFDGQTWDELKRPVAAGGMSMGEGRELDPNGGGTVFNGCPNSPDGKHHFKCYANMNSVEYFRCQHCPKEYVD